VYAINGIPFWAWYARHVRDVPDERLVKMRASLQRPAQCPPELFAAAERVLDADERARLDRSAEVARKLDEHLFQQRLEETGQPTKDDPDREWRRPLVHPQTKFDLIYRRMLPVSGEHFASVSRRANAAPAGSADGERRLGSGRTAAR
jgi:hypothetical protein